ncbi:cytidylate kinase-like family protein [Treponema sp. OMZ 840]|uniref:cytidylate kinase-like family protein n=1 Tax=Treponema sp. OMZ 840 TaxID=244313 RepID=UPI003D9504A2
MAVIAISRQVAACGDEIAAELATLLGYTFIDRKDIEDKIISLGFPAEKLEKYDEKKPGFFASLAKNRDEYLDYLQTAILEAAALGNCILIGRGAFAVLEKVPNLLAVRFVASDSVRTKRLMDEFAWDEKQALQRMEESDSNRIGFHKSFFNISVEDPAHFHVVLNTGLFSAHNAALVLAEMCKKLITKELEQSGKQKIEDLLTAQHLVNTLVFEYKLSINFLRAIINGKTLTLQGIAESPVVAEKAVKIASDIIKDKEVLSAISIVQDFKSYP